MSRKLLWFFIPILTIVVILIIVALLIVFGPMLKSNPHFFLPLIAVSGLAADIFRLPIGDIHISAGPTL